MEPPCVVCTNHSRTEPREAVVRTEHWRVAHAFGTSLPGWLVLDAIPHIASLAELTGEAAAELGPLLRELSIALAEVVGCTKTYVMQFSEAEGFAHLHIHLVPRMPDQPVELTGPGIFGALGRPAADCVGEADRDRLALALRAATARNHPGDGLGG